MAGEGTRSGFGHFSLNLLRIGAGLLFMQHGAQKLFAVLGREGAAEFFSQLWLAGVLEFWCGLLIVLGLWTRPVAFVLAGEMAWAYLQSHLPRGFFPVTNGGELAALFFLIWVLLVGNGGGAFSVDGLVVARRRASAAD